MSATDAPFPILSTSSATSGSSSSTRSFRSSQPAPCHPITGAKRRPLTGWVPGACAASTVASASTRAGIDVTRRIPTRITTMTTDTTLTPSRLWKKMSLEQRQHAARAFWNDEEGTNDQVQAALLIAQQKKFRPKTVIALDVERKTRHLASLVTLPDTIVARALIAYHLAEQ